jgi:AcrR family transcriptional regulator
MGVAERRAKEKDEKRQRILDATGQIILEEGFEKLTLRKLADKLEYSAGTIYLYFKDKNELIFEYCDETFELLLEEMEGLDNPELDPRVAFRQSGEAYVRFALQNPSAYIVTFNLPPPPGVEGFLEHNTPAGMRCYEILRTLIQRCQDSGHFRQQEIEAAAQGVWASVHGLASLLILCHGHYQMPWASQESIIRSTLDMVERGLSAN